MSKILYRIGIIDDDPAKVTQMITMIRLCCNDENGNMVKEKYSNYALDPLEILLVPGIEEMAQSIIDNKVDAVIIDYKLSSQQSISYTGVALAKEVALQLYEFPIFELTTYQDDLFERELFDSYLVFDFDRYISDDSERIELNSKLIEQIKKYRKVNVCREQELVELLPKAGQSVAIDERILELDTQIERAIDGKRTLSSKLKKELTADKINLLISKIDKLMEGE